MRFWATTTMLALAAACAGPPPAAKVLPEKRAPVAAAPSSKPSEPCPIRSFPYEGQPPTDLRASLPPIPPLPDRPLRVGDAYSVWGASYFLRSRVHRSEVKGKDIAVRGFIIKTNLPGAPRCAVHATGRADPEGCRAPVPTFWLADAPGAEIRDAIQVMGWASNYAQIFDAIRVYDSPQGGHYDDMLWGQALPNPLPAVGASVTVSGRYDSTFGKASSGSESDPDMGILDSHDIEVLALAPELATLPGVKRKMR